jgi:hypothetical protein
MVLLSKKESAPSTAGRDKKFRLHAPEQNRLIVRRYKSDGRHFAHDLCANASRVCRERLTRRGPYLIEL